MNKKIKGVFEKLQPVEPSEILKVFEGGKYFQKVFVRTENGHCIYHCFACGAEFDDNASGTVCPKCGNKAFSVQRSDFSYQAKVIFANKVDGYVVFRYCDEYIFMDNSFKLCINHFESYRIVFEILSKKYELYDFHNNDWRKISKQFFLRNKYDPIYKNYLSYIPNNATKIYETGIKYIDNFFCNYEKNGFFYCCKDFFASLEEKSLEEKSISHSIKDFTKEKGYFEDKIKNEILVSNFPLLDEGISSQIEIDKETSNNFFTNYSTICPHCNTIEHMTVSSNSNYLLNYCKCSHCGKRFSTNAHLSKSSPNHYEYIEIEETTSTIYVVRFACTFTLNLDCKKVMNNFSIESISSFKFKEDGLDISYDKKTPTYSGRKVSMDAEISELLIKNKNDTISTLKSHRLFKRSGLGEFIEEKNTYVSVFQYLLTYKEYPEIEMLSKFKMNALVCYVMLCFDGDRKDIPAKLRPKTGLRFTKKQIENLRKLPSTSISTTENFVDLTSRDPDATYEDYQYLSAHNTYRYFKGILTLKINYLNTQEVKKYIEYVDNFQCCPPEESLMLWHDYLRMLKQLDCDLNDRRLVFTNSLKREHDKAARKISIISDEKTVASFMIEINKQEYQSLAYHTERFNVVIPESPNDLHEEGRILNHCVGGYVNSVSKGWCKIVFLRDKNNKSLCTMEIQKNSIVQARGFSNSEPSNTVRAYIKEYSKEKKLACCF